MKLLKIFLKVLELTFGNKRGFYIPKYTVTKTKINCINSYNLDVWCIDGSYKTSISSVHLNYNINDYTEDEIKEDLISKTILNILKYYGL